MEKTFSSKISGKRNFLKNVFENPVKFFNAFFLFSFFLVTPKVFSQIVPYTIDANTVLLDHFDGSTSASILAYNENGAACGTSKPSVSPSYTYGSGPVGLSQALILSPPSGQPAGSASYLQYPGGQLLSNPDGTVEFQIYITSYGTGLALVDQGQYYSSCGGWTFGMGISATGQLTASAWAAFNLNSGTSVVPLNTWTHVATTWGSAGAKLYINGILVGTDANTGMAASGWGGSVMVRLGTHSGNSAWIDELRISNIQRIFSSASPVVWYSFIGGSLLDVSGNGNNATNIGAVVSTDRFGVHGNAYDFNGTDAYIDCGNGASLNVTNAITLSAWVNPRSIDNGRIVSKAPSYEIDMYNQNLRFNCNGTEILAASLVGCLNKWTFITAMWDGATAKIYINGSLQASVPWSGTLTPTSANLNLGKYPDFTYPLLNGVLGDVRIYNRALTDDEVGILWKEGGYDPTLAAYFPFDGNAVDISGNNNNGTYYNTSSTSDRFGLSSGFSFNGSDSYIDCGNGSSLNDMGNSITLSAWINPSSLAGGRIISKVEAGGSGGGFEIGVYLDEVYFGFNNSSLVSANISGYLNQWLYVVGLYDGSDAKLYVNGVLVSTFTFTSVVNNSSLNLTIGAMANHAPIGFFNGSIDDIRIFRRALPEDEIQSLYLEKGWNPPDVPQNISLTSFGTTAQMDWQAVPKAAYYRIYRGTDSTKAVFIDSTAKNYFAESNLDIGIMYYYRVTAVDSSGVQGAMSRAVRTEVSTPFVFSRLTYTDIKDAPFTTNRINGSNDAFNQLRKGQIILYRTNSGHYGKFQIQQYGYTIKFRWVTYDTSGTVYSQGTWLSVDGTMSCDLDDGREESASSTSDFFWDQRTAVIRFLVPRNGAAVALYARDTVFAPMAPANLKVIQGNGQVKLVWNKNTEPDFLRYRIYRKTGLLGLYSKIDSTGTGNISDTSRSITGLTNGTLYFFRVTAFDSLDLESWYSNVVATVPQPLNKDFEYTADANTVLLLHMNETNGTVVNDASSYGNSGIASGTSIADGKFGKVRDFPGSYCSVTVNNDLLGDGNSSYTMEAWIMPRSMGTSQSYPIMSQRNSGNEYPAIEFSFGPLSNIDFLHRTDSYTYFNLVSDASTIRLNQWSHVAIIRDAGSSLLSIYVNGVLIKYGSLTNLGTLTGLNIFTIGKKGWGSAADGFDGLIDEIRVSNIVRDPSTFNLQLPPRDLIASVAGASIVLNWQNGGGAVPLMKYRIYSGSDSTNCVLIDSTTSLTLTSPPLLVGTHYARVTAVDSTGFESAPSFAASATVTVSQIGGVWTTKGPVSFNRMCMASGEINGSLYALGGWNGCTPYANVEMYDTILNNWSQKQPMQTARGYFAVAKLKGKLYAVGGAANCGTGLISVEAYDPIGNQWVYRASLPQPMYNHGVAVVRDTLYAFGIPTSGPGTGSLFAYDPDGDTWTTKAPMPTPRSLCAFAVVNGIIYVMGGQDNAGTASRAVEAYDPSTNSWSTKASIPSDRFWYPAAASINGLIYVAGGQDASGCLATADAFNPTTNTWVPITPMSTARNSLTGTAFKGSFYVLGGNDNATTLATVEAFTPDGSLNTAPASPKGLVAMPGNTEVTLKWNKNSEPDFLCYRIYFGTSPNKEVLYDSSSFSNLDTTKLLTGLTNGTLYYFRVTAMDNVRMESDPAISSEVSTTPMSGAILSATPLTLDFGYVPSATTSIEKTYSIYGANLTPASASISIAPPAGFEVSLSPGTAYSTTSISVSYSGATLSATPIYVRFMPTAGVPYNGNITNSGGGAASLQVYVTGVGNVAPAAPTNLTAFPGEGQVTLIWNKNTESDFLRYRIFRNTIPLTPVKVDSTILGITDTMRVITGLTNGTIYYFSLSAVDSGGLESSHSISEVMATPGVSTVGRPLNPSVSPSVWTNTGTFTISWTNPPVSNITAVYYSIDALPTTASPGTRLSITQPQFQVVSPTPGVHWIYFYLEDNGGVKNSDSLASVQILYDNQVPNLPNDFTNSGLEVMVNNGSVTVFNGGGGPQQVNIYATASDNSGGSGIKLMKLYYVRDGVTQMDSLLFTPSSNYVQIPTTAFVSSNQARGVSYRIIATDSAQNISSTVWKSIVVKNSGTITTPSGQFPAATNYPNSMVNAYRIFSVPYDLDDKAPASVLSSLGPHMNNNISYYNWRFQRYDGSGMDDIEQFGGTQILRPGNGFFLIVRDQNRTITIGSNKAASAAKMNDTGIVLQSGWNIVGCPLNMTIPYANLIFQNGTDQGHAFFDGVGLHGGWWIQTDVDPRKPADWDALKPWAGIAIKASNNNTILKFQTFSKIPGLGKSVLDKTAVEELPALSSSSENWMVSVNAYRSDIDMRCEENGFGMAKNAIDGYDGYDAFMPPIIGDKNVALYFKNPEGAMVQDIRPLNEEGNVWEMRVVTGDPSAQVKLHIANKLNVPNPAFEEYLIDIDQKMAYNLKEIQSLEINSGNGIRNFRVVIGKKAYVAKNNAGVELTPSIVKLYTNYPNPFNAETMIRYAIPGATVSYAVTLKVFNVIGQEIATLVQEQKMSGYYEVRWNAAQQSSGVYFYQLTASDGTNSFKDMKKMILMK
jgi:fibronectin type 3 domain-containing protein